MFLVAFSAIYLALSHENAGTFTQHLTHARALYFTITIFSTVGFGDITPRTDAARLVVSAQMLLDLALIGAGVRLILNVAKSSFDTAEGSAAGESSGIRRAGAAGTVPAAGPQRPCHTLVLAWSRGVG